MVKGISKFKEHFADFTGQYVFIGGTACDIILEKQNVEFRATKDLDIVLVIELMNHEFVTRFIDFIHEGGYQHIKKGSGENQYYRFCNPINKEYPVMIELFCKRPEYLIGMEQKLAPIHICDDAMSLSAILLNDEYYQLLKRGTIIVDGLSVLRSECLILFKIKAWLDLTDRKEKGERIDGKDIRKHRNDVIRLVSMMDNNLTFQIEECIRHDVEMFLKMNYQHPINTKPLGLNNVSFEQILKRIEGCYLKSNS